MNLLLHLLNVALVFALFGWLGRGRIEIAAIVALFFAIHPMHVESVAWASGRKDVLYSAFFLLAWLAYLAFRRPGVEPAKRAVLYALTTLLFLASLLSKPAAVVFPIVMLLVDYLKARPLDRWMFLEKLPWFAASIAIGIVTIHAQTSSIAEFYDFSLIERIMIAAYGLMMYTVKLVAPVGLSALYPYPEPGPDLSVVFTFAPFLALGLGMLVWLAARRERVVAFGVLFFLVSLAPVLQLVTVGGAVMAERYTYLAYLGPLFVVASSCSALSRRPGPRWALHRLGPSAVLAGFALAFAVGTHQRCDVWQDSLTLWNDVILKTRGEASVPYNSRGSVYMDLGREAEAIADFDSALKLRPGYAMAYSNRGAALHRTGRTQAALQDLAKATEIDPDDRKAYLNRAQIHLDTGQYERAVTDLNRALDLDPDNSDALQGRGVAHRHLGEHDLALRDLARAIELRPMDGPLYLSRSLVFEALGEWQDAIRDAHEARRLGAEVSPKYLGRLEERLRAAGRGEEVAQLRRGIASNPDDRSLPPRLADLLVARGEPDEAMAALGVAVERWPCEGALRLKAAELAFQTKGRAAQMAIGAPVRSTVRWSRRISSTGSGRARGLRVSVRRSTAATHGRSTRRCPQVDAQPARGSCSPRHQGAPRVARLGPASQDVSSATCFGGPEHPGVRVDQVELRTDGGEALSRRGPPIRASSWRSSRRHSATTRASCGASCTRCPTPMRQPTSGRVRSGGASSRGAR